MRLRLLCIYCQVPSPVYAAVQQLLLRWISWQRPTFRLASAYAFVLARECTFCGFLMTKPSFTSFRMFWPGVKIGGVRGWPKRTSNTGV